MISVSRFINEQDYAALQQRRNDVFKAARAAGATVKEAQEQATAHTLSDPAPTLFDWTSPDNGPSLTTRTRYNLSLDQGEKIDALVKIAEHYRDALERIANADSTSPEHYRQTARAALRSLS